MSKRYKAVKAGFMQDEGNVVMRIDSIEATRMAMPYQVPGFRTGPYMSQKDRPRKKDWRNYDADS